MNVEGGFAKIKKLFPQIAIALLCLAGLLLFMGNSEKKKDTVSELRTWESELEEFLENMEGVGKCKVLIYPSQEVSSANAVKGISIVCQGDSVSVKAAITEALKTLFGLDATQISISKMK